MTTIAYRDGVVAADTEVDDDGKRQFHTKLYRVTFNARKAVLAIAGSQLAAQPIKHWISQGAQAPLYPNLGLDFTAVIITPSGVFELYKESAGFPYELAAQPFYAWGSGSKAALGAMQMGADAVRAVEIAALHDTYTGGPVSRMSIETE